VKPGWVSAQVSISHPDYVPHVLSLRWDGATLWWGDPSSQSVGSGDDQTLRIPLGRIRFAPGELPPFGKPSGKEKGVYIQQSGAAQRYKGIDFELGPTPTIRTLRDFPSGKLPTCILVPHDDDGWRRFSAADTTGVEPGKSGGFIWLEYGSPETRPQEPRFLIAVYVPLPDKALKDGTVDALVFFSPTTVIDPYPVSTYPFRDKYPYAANAREVRDETGQKQAANVQPYVLLGMKYLFHPTHLVGMSLRAELAPVVIMPIIPRASGKNGARQMWQPFNSQAGMWRLLIEIVQFLEREGYTGSMFSTGRFNGVIAPTSGNAAAPPPAFISTNRKRLGIRDLIVSAYSSGSPAMDKLLTTTAIISPEWFPPALFGADAAEFDKHWTEFWGLDLFLNEKQTGVKRTRFEQQLRSWLTRDSRRLRLYQSGWTLEREFTRHVLSRNTAAVVDAAAHSERCEAVLTLVGGLA
jgi:hypothetical protein